MEMNILNFGIFNEFFSRKFLNVLIETKAYELTIIVVGVKFLSLKKYNKNTCVIQAFEKRNLLKQMVQKCL